MAWRQRPGLLESPILLSVSSLAARASAARPQLPQSWIWPKKHRTSKSCGLSSFIMVDHRLSWFIIVYHGWSWFMMVYLSWHHAAIPCKQACWICSILRHNHSNTSRVQTTKLCSSHFWGEMNGLYTREHRVPWGFSHTFTFSYRADLRHVLVDGLEHFLFSDILGIIIPIDFHIFQRSWNHQPVFDRAWQKPRTKKRLRPLL